jgi:hemolysin activation/secretion protein
VSSIGLGVAMNWTSWLALNVAAGQPLKRGVGGEDGRRLLFRAQLAY